MTPTPDPALSGTCAIAIMAKAPRPGHVKTRLQAIVTPDEAAQLGAAFLRDVSGNVRAAAGHAPIHPYVAYAPAGQEARFDGLLVPGTGLVLADGAGGDAAGVDGFGRCLLHAIRALLARGYGAACVLNADSPTLPTAWLADAANRLLRPGRRAVLGPADDGGYWLLGMQAEEPGLFARIAWSTDAVAATTQARAAEAGIPLDTLGTWYDVDDRDGLHRLVREVDGTSPAGHAYAAPATAACLDASGTARAPRRATGMTRRGLVLGVLGAGILLLIAAGVGTRVPEDIGGMTRERAEFYIAAAAGAGALYAVAVWQVLRGPCGRGTLAVVLGLALAMRALTLLSPPLLSTDIYRYVWDGRVQAAGINPYAYLPAAPALRALRDGGAGAEAIYPNINRADYAPTIYPPAAQAIFAAVGLAWPTIWGMKAAMLLFDLLGIAAALLLLRAAAPAAGAGADPGLESPGRLGVRGRRPHRRRGARAVWPGAARRGPAPYPAAAGACAGRRGAVQAAAGRAGARAVAALGLAVAPRARRSRSCWPMRPTPWAAGAPGGGCWASCRATHRRKGWATAAAFSCCGHGRRSGPCRAGPALAYAALAGAGLLALAAWVSLRAPLPDAVPARARVICRDAVLLTGATMAVLSPHYPWYYTALVLPCVVWPNPAALSG